MTDTKGYRVTEQGRVEVDPVELFKSPAVQEVYRICGEIVRLSNEAREKKLAPAPEKAPKVCGVLHAHRLSGAFGACMDCGEPAPAGGWPSFAEPAPPEPAATVSDAVQRRILNEPDVVIGAVGGAARNKPTPPVQNSETAWLIERTDGSSLYWGAYEWTTPEFCVRFTRKVDADKVILAQKLGNVCMASEHQWVAIDPPAQPEPAAPVVIEPTDRPMDFNRSPFKPAAPEMPVALHRAWLMLDVAGQEDSENGRSHRRAAVALRAWWRNLAEGKGEGKP